MIEYNFNQLKRSTTAINYSNKKFANASAFLFVQKIKILNEQLVIKSDIYKPNMHGSVSLAINDY